jgi:ABC-type nitrate/sulfonate/bicarbonate transport system substrate-binding protein
MPTPVWYATAHLQLTANIVLHHPQVFADEGFEVHAMCPGAGQPIVNAMLQGRAEYCNVLALPLMRAAQGQGLKFVCSYQPTGWELWAQPGIGSLHDLADKRLGLTSPMARSYLDDGLRAAGVDPKSVLDGPPIQLDGAGAEQMRRGAVDAAILMPPVTVMAGSLGMRRLANLGEWGHPVAYGLMTTDHLLAQRRDEVVRFVRALLRSVRALKADRELAIKLTRAQGVPEDFVAATVDDTLPQLDGDGHLPEATQRRWVDAAARFLGIDEAVPLSRVFDFSVLDDANRGL